MVVMRLECLIEKIFMYSTRALKSEGLFYCLKGGCRVWENLSYVLIARKRHLIY